MVILLLWLLALIFAGAFNPDDFGSIKDIQAENE
jgi:hypothetical protein